MNELLIDKIGNPRAKISPTINSLNEVIRFLEDHTPHKIYAFTTNYDQHFENSYRNSHGGAAAKGPEVLIYKGAVSPMKSQKLNATINGELNVPAEFWGPSSQTVLYKLHGCISQPTNNPDDHTLVITEEDYINFLANALQESNKEKAILNHMRGRLALSTILFIGYSLADWNFRAVFKGTVEPRLDQKTDRSYAVQRRKPAEAKGEDTGWDALVEFWDDKKVDILDVDAEQFVKDLLEKVKEQLGDKSKGQEAS